jgi:hypothetical protein
MDVERFWAIVDAARGDVDGWSADLDRQWAHALYTRLVVLPPDDVLDFDRRLLALRRPAATPELAAATQLVVRPYPGSWRDPSFFSFESKFRALVNCLVMLGRDTLERAVADPESLADHPLIRAVADGELPGSVLLAVRVDDAAGDAYCELTGVDDDAYLDLREQSTMDDRDLFGGAEADDAEDADVDGDLYAAWLAERLPRLHAMFPPDAEPPAAPNPDRAPPLWNVVGRLLVFAAVVAVLAAFGFVLRH